MITAGTNFSLPAEAEKADSVFFAWGMEGGRHPLCLRGCRFKTKDETTKVMKQEVGRKQRFAEPIRIYSNVRNGIGLVGAGNGITQEAVARVR